MISEDSLPTKSRSLRAKSIAKRLATEKNQNGGSSAANNSAGGNHLKKSSSKRSSSSSSKHHPMSKYRRKVANAKERERMKLVSEAFDKLSSVVPVYKMMTVQNQIPQAAPQTSSSDLENKNPVTKVSTLRCAIAYINSLQRLIEDAERGVLDPSLYSLSEDDEIVENQQQQQSKKKVHSGQKSKKMKERSKKKRNEQKSNKNHHHKKGDNPLKRTKKTGKSFKVRQYHASDFSARIKHVNKNHQMVDPATFKPMSKAQLNLAIAKGLQNCKPIYTPPPPMTKKNPVQQAPTLTSTPAAVLMPHFNQQNSSTPLQLIQLRPLNLETPMDNDSEDYSNLESVFLTSSPCTSSTSSMMASSPTSSTSGSSSDSCFNAILEEPHILDDIQAVLMDADHFDLLV